jgi:histidine triad (HIT) family protein
MTYSGTDIYCDLIIPGKLEVKVVKETEDILAFYHTKPYWPVHIVVTPKQHIASLIELEPGSEIAKELLQVVQEVARTVTESEGACRVSTNLGRYQDSKHLHVHVSSGEHSS